MRVPSNLNLVPITIPKFLKIFVACGAKNVSLNPIFPKFLIFRRPRRRKMCHWMAKVSPFWSVTASPAPIWTLMFTFSVLKTPRNVEIWAFKAIFLEFCQFSPFLEKVLSYRRNQAPGIYFKIFLKISKQNFWNFFKIEKTIILVLKLVRNHHLDQNLATFSLQAPNSANFPLKAFIFFKISAPLAPKFWSFRSLRIPIFLELESPPPFGSRPLPKNPLVYI